MTEDPRLTREILKFFTREEIRYPADVTIEQVVEAFPKVNSQKVKDHIRLAINENLLDAEIREIRTFGGGGVVISRIAGMTSAGREYLKDAQPVFRKNFRVGEAWNNLIIRVLAIVIGGVILAYLTRFIPANSPQPVPEQSAILPESPTPE
ncbi:MAG: hypothetical protein OXQ89_17870 [Rhodospirillaceae bacterium]|nr:hypothetical protein [Rhodospirillaceae bacterium]